MNKEYTYIEGKVIIWDEKNKQTQRDYYDNLGKVLVQENLIETMERKIQELENELYQEKRSCYIPMIAPSLFCISTVGVPLMAGWITGSNSFFESVKTVFGSMNYALALSIFTDIMGIAFEILAYIDYKRAIKKEKGIDNEIVFLKRQLEKERGVLKSLTKERLRDNESTELKTMIVDDVKQLEELKNLLELYFDLGYNEEKYYQYYQQGKIDKKLQKWYTEEGLQLAKECLEENGPSLALQLH